MAKYLDSVGLAQVWAKITTLLAGKAPTSHTHTISNVTDLQSELNNRYKKSETYSQSEINTKLDNLNTLRILNKSSVNQGIVNATTSTIDSVCTQYVQTNYSRAPKEYDTIIVTLTDADNDKVKYTYSEASDSWVDLGREGIKISQATSSDAGIMKLYTSVDASNTDGAPSQAAVKAAVDTLTGQYNTLSSNTYKKTETYSKSEVYAKSETYARSEVYTKTEINNMVQTLSETEINAIIGS